VSLKVAFYKHNKHLFNRLVPWWTKGKYSHVELVFSDGLSASSSHIDCGVRYKKIIFRPERWDVFELEGFNEKEARTRFNQKLNHRYDYWGIFGFVWGAKKDSKNREFCSEVVMYSLGFKESWRFDPNCCFAVLEKFFKK